MLSEAPGDDPIKKQTKNIQMFFNTTILESLKNVVLESTALAP